MQKFIHPKVIIVLVNYNNWSDTVECLESIFKLSYTNFSVVVVDNDSRDNSFENILDWANGLKVPSFNDKFYKQTKIDYYPVKKPIPNNSYTWPLQNETTCKKAIQKLSIIKSNQNLGFAGGNNIGTKFAIEQDDVHLFWYLNNDTVVEKDALLKIINFVQEYESSGGRNFLIGTKLLFYHNPFLLQGIGGKYNKWFALTNHIYENTPESNLQLVNNYSREIDYPIGASMVVKKQLIEEIGYMAEDYFLYFEELDWAERVKKKNGEVISFLDCKIYHKESASIGNTNSAKSKLADYYNLRNRILFSKKYFKIFLPIVYLGFIPVILNRLRRRQFDRIKMILKILIQPNKPFKKE